MSKKGKDSNSIIDKIVNDVGKSSATKQLIIGSTSGWATGYIGMKVGKVAALALGGGIIVVQIANHAGYIKINWNKINRNIDKITDKVEENVTGQSPSWMDKVERYVDNKVDNAGDLVTKKQRKAKSWYNNITGNSDFVVKEIHVFLVSFVAGLALGVACG